MKTNGINISAEQIYHKHMRKTYSIRVLAFFLMALLLVALGLVTMEKISIFTFICVIVAVLFIEYIIVLFRQIWFNNLYKIVLNECDPEKFVKVIKLLQLKMIQGEKIKFSITEAYGLYYCGSFQEALGLLESIHVVHIKGKNRFTYYGILANCSSKENDMEGLQLAYNQTEKILKTLKSNSKEIKMAKLNLKHMKGLIAEQEKDYKTYRQILNELLESATTPLNLVSAHYSLAKIEFAEKNFAKAKEECNYVIEHGNKLFHVQEAKELLEKI